jgi:hypothetical protein
MDANAVGKESWKSWVKDVRDQIAFVSSREAAEVERSIENLRREALESPQPLARVDVIQEQQRKVERSLRTLILRLEEFGDRSALLQLLRDVRDRQKELMEETQSRTGNEPRGSEP